MSYLPGEGLFAYAEEVQERTLALRAMVKKRPSLDDYDNDSAWFDLTRFDVWGCFDDRFDDFEW
jgi:hypothetical protein